MRFLVALVVSLVASVAVAQHPISNMPYSIPPTSNDYGTYTIRPDYGGQLQYEGWERIARNTWGDGQNHSQMLINPYVNQTTGKAIIPLPTGTDAPHANRGQVWPPRAGLDINVNTVPAVVYVLYSVPMNPADGSLAVIHGVYTNRNLAVYYSRRLNYKSRIVYLAPESINPVIR